MSGKLSFTINFGEEDQALLSFLQTFPQEQWEGLIKEALREYTENDSDSGIFLPAEKQESATSAPWNLEELYVGPSAKESMLNNILMLDNDSGVYPKEEKLFSNHHPSNPLNHLFALIGEDEDEDVLELLLNGNSKSQEPKEHTQSVNSHRDDSGMDLQTDTESLSFQTVAKGKGLAFILNQVIGEEEDPEVLGFFKERSKERN